MRSFRTALVCACFIVCPMWLAACETFTRADGTQDVTIGGVTEQEAAGILEDANMFWPGLGALGAAGVALVYRVARAVTTKEGGK